MPAAKRLGGICEAQTVSSLGAGSEVPNMAWILKDATNKLSTLVLVRSDFVFEGMESSGAPGRIDSGTCHNYRSSDRLQVFMARIN